MISWKLKGLLANMLQKDEERRISWDELQKNSLFHLEESLLVQSS